MIDGQNMHVRAAKALHKQSPKETFTEVIEPEIKFSSYVQNEEQTDNTKWNRVISEAEYRDRSVTIHKNDDKDNTNNPA